MFNEEEWGKNIKNGLKTVLEMEHSGFEPLTFALPARRSPS
jgi:hypothetical protein